MKLALLSVVDDSTPLRRLTQKMCAPLGLLYLEAWLAEHAPEVEVLVTYEPDAVVRFEPDLVGLSSVTENMVTAERLATQLAAATHAPVILGGAHISLVPASLPDACVAGVIGEGEATLTEIVRVFQANGTLTATLLESVAGLAIRRDGEVVRTARRPVIQPIDSIPFPRRSWPGAHGISYLITSRGCPFNCAFCSSATLTDSYRMHSADYVLDALQWTHDNIAPTHIKFFDDLFVARRKRVFELADKVEAAGIRFPAGMSGFARTDLLDEDVIVALERLGFTGLSIGIESGSQRILDKVGKRNSVERNQQVLDLCRQHGITTGCSFVIGWPGETDADLEATARFIEDNRRSIHQIEICPAVPLPGTALWFEAKRAGRVDDDVDWSILRDHSLFTEFEVDDYLYINPDMPLPDFAVWVERYRDLYNSFLGSTTTWLSKRTLG